MSLGRPHDDPGAMPAGADAADGAWLQVNVLGVPSWTTQEGLVPMADARAAVLVAMAALDGPVSRNHAAELFWPDSQGNARTNLRVLLHRLQQAAGTRLFATGDRLALLPHVRVDVAADDDLLVARCLQLGASNLRLLHGVELPGLPDAAHWLAAARRQVEQRITRMLVAWLDKRPAAEDLARATAVAEALIALNPLSETGYRALMRVRVDAGDRAGALTVFERCRLELDEHLGTRPDRQTTALHREILRRRDDDGTAPQALPLRPLLQREAELADMAAALSARRVVIVEGPGGSGKSTMLAHLARERADLHWTADASDGQAPLAGLLRLTQHIAKLASRSGVAIGVTEAVERLRRLQALEPSGVPAASLPRLARDAVTFVVALQQAGHSALIIDDIHLFDDTSVDVMAQVLVTSDELMPSFGFVLAYRPVRARRRVRALCEKLTLAGRLKLVHPTSFKREAVLQLMPPAPGSEAERLATADRLVAISGGTPGVLAELLSAGEGPDVMDDALAPQIRTLLLERLRACSSTAEGVAQLASVAGASFSVGLAADIAGLSSWKVAEKWNELLLAGVFDARGFAFPLMEAAVRESVPDAVRQFMHGEVAKALERQGHAAERIAHHWRAAGDHARATGQACVAAAVRLQGGDLLGAIDQLDQALPEGERVEPPAPVQVIALLQLTALCLEAGRVERITGLLEAASRAPAGLVERGVSTALGGRALLAMGQHGAARAALHSALPLLAADAKARRDVARWALLAAHGAGEPADDALITLACSDLGGLSINEWRADGASVQTPADARRAAEALRALGVLPGR